MTDLNRVKLVEARQFDGRGVKTSIARSELRSALDSDGAAELVLEVTRVAGADAEVEAHTLALSLDREILEALFAAEDGDEVGLEFDARELGAALDEDEVEAHGLRERAAVLAVAATAAAGFAGHAAAQPTADSGGKPVAAARGLTAEEIWDSAPPAVRQAAAQASAERAARLRTPAPFRPSTGGSGIDISAPSPSEAALAAEAALLIAGAGLVIRNRKQSPTRPA